MTAVTRPRGPLPPRVYWTRRLLVLGVALFLVVGVARLLGGSPDESENPSARPASATASSPSDAATPSLGQTSSTPAATTSPATTKTAKRKAAEVETPKAVPTGPCPDSDVLVRPSVDEAFAGQDVVITLNLSTADSPACNWEVSSSSVVLKLTSGSDRIWSTQDCPSAITRQSVVLRDDEVTKVGVTWGGQRSDDECTRTTAWAEPGYYHAQAAAFGSEPDDEQFELLEPVAPTITPTPKADKKNDEKQDEKQDASSGQAEAEAEADPDAQEETAQD